MMPKASPLSQLRSASSESFAREALMSQEVMSLFLSSLSSLSAWRSMRSRICASDQTNMDFQPDATPGMLKPIRASQGVGVKRPRRVMPSRMRSMAKWRFPVASMLKDLPKESWPMMSKEK